MPRFEKSECYAAPPAKAFALFRRTADRVRMAPPDLHLKLEEGPAELQKGSRLTVCGRRWGLSQRMASEITALEEDALIVEEQRKGPFRSWKHTQRFAPTPEGGVRITDTIEYEPPGGMIGLIATAEVVRGEIERLFAYRRERLVELLVKAMPSG
jgi:ligand-binding SRPBCC domain-containing protein